MKKILTASIVFSIGVWASFIPTFGGGTPKGRVDPNFSRDNNQSIVTDRKEKKSYSDITNTKQYTHAEALKYCQTLSLAGFSDWRLPNKEELKSLLDYTRKPVNIKYPFANTQEGRYWSSTKANYNKAYYIDFDLGRYSRAKEIKAYYVLCVRDRNTNSN